MKAKPTRFAGWVRKKFVKFLPTRRHQAATTTHAQRGERVKHMLVRIGRDIVRVKHPYR